MDSAPYDSLLLVMHPERTNSVGGMVGYAASFEVRQEEYSLLSSTDWVVEMLRRVHGREI